MNITLKIVEGRYVMQTSNVIDINVIAAAKEKQKKENQQQIKLNLKKREGKGGEN